MKMALQKRLVAVVLATFVAGCVTSADNDSGPLDGYLFEAAAAAEQAADYSAAAGHYGKLREARPDNVVVLFGLARNLRYSGQATRAVAVLEAESERWSSTPRFQLELGKGKLASGDSRGAMPHLMAAAAAEPDDWEAHSTLGIAHDLAEDYAAGQAAYRRALDLSPANPAVLNNLAISLALSGDLAGAIATLSDTPKTARNNPQIRQNLALFFGIQGDMAAAEQLGRVDLDPETVRRNLDIYARLRGR